MERLSKQRDELLEKLSSRDEQLANFKSSLAQVFCACSPLILIREALKKRIGSFKFISASLGLIPS